MKRHLSILILTLMCAAVAYAVTDNEMDQARAITARLYLRWANDGSGYLDNLSPKSMADLEKNLKQKEKENLRAFKAVGLPAGYQEWDKARLVEYWSATFFRSPGLNPAGARAKDRVRKALSNMKISAAAAPKAEEKPAANTAEVRAPGAPAEASPANTAADNPAAPSSLSADPESAAVAAVHEAEAELSQIDSLTDTEPVTPKRNSYTWVYITILCILVAVVVALVVFASKVLKGQPRRDDARDEPARRDSRMMDSAALVAPETNEWRDRARQAEAERDLLGQECDSQRNELERLRSHIAELERKMQSMQQEAPAAAPRHEEHAAESLRRHIEDERQETTQPAQEPPRRQPQRATQPAVIYLGRANNKGIFVRADRNLKPEATVYRLETTDGYAGTFRVAGNADIWDRALANPEQVLAGGCVAADLGATAGMTQVLTESAGTAIFEGGCWKVIRKAKVRYQ